MVEGNIEKETIENLITRARQVQQHAYAPYSEFAVGAAILTDKNEIFSGCNVENSSYGLTICAERNALASMRASSDLNIPLIIAVVGRKGEPCYPCGACLQVLCEFNSAMQVVLETSEGFEIRDLDEFLPFRFNLE